jgi:hypothetical protein
VYLFGMLWLSGVVPAAPDELYLLTFKAYPHHEKKERNLYELTPSVQVVGNNLPLTADIMTSKDREGMGVRYGVHAVIRVRLLNTSNSAKTPASVRKSVYVLVYDPVYTLCATSYSITAGTIHYFDYESGKPYEFPIRHHRSIPIYELQVVSQNVLPNMLRTR